MRSRFVVALCMLSSLGAPAMAAPAAVEAYGSLEAVDHVTINPAGQRLAWVVNDGKSTQVTVLDLESRKTLRSFAVEPGFKVREIDWADDDNLLFAVSATLTSTRRNWPSRLELLRWLAGNVATGKLQILLTDGNKRVLGVPFVQSQMMDNALKAAGVPHQLVTLDSEDHWLSSGVTRTRMLSEIEKFLAANLAPKR